MCLPLSCSFIPKKGVCVTEVNTLQQVPLFLEHCLAAQDLKVRTMTSLLGLNYTLMS